MKKAISNRLSLTVLGFIYISLVFIFSISVAAQNTRNTDYSPDKSLKSNARVNPSTLAMEFAVPLGGYPGRAGNSLPVVFNYSSKVWQIQALHSFPHPTIGTVTNTKPVYAERTAGGWSSNLGSPRIDYKFDIYEGGDHPATQEPPGYVGQIHSLFEPGQGDPQIYNLYSVKRLRVVMADGSSSEFRANDTIVQCGDTGTGCPIDAPGIYLSVDGSQMRLEINASGAATLYLPDGGFYGFEANAYQAKHFTDANGNRQTYDAANRRWTDTLGRVVGDPLPDNWNGMQNQTVGDITASFPGFGGGGTINATFSWRYLKDPNGGESGLSDPSQTLRYEGSSYCQGNGATAVPGNFLFDRLTLQTRVCSSQLPFNPIVLTKITLANGQSYQFKYNLHGEIEKIIYPSGGYERFAYAYIAPIQVSDETYDQTNRGVVDRWVSAKGDSTDETQMHWNYAAERGTALNPAPYKMTTVNPDGTSSEQLIHDEPNPQAQRPYGFDNAKTGRAYESRFYSATNQLLGRTLTSYAVTGALAGGYFGATRDVRPEREISIGFEPGASSALAAMSETVYDTNGNSDAAYFSSLNPKQTKTYHYIVLDLATAQNAAIEQIAALFTSANLATVGEVDYLYEANYKARNITGLITETRVKDASGNTKAKNQISYDESAYPLIYAGTDANWQDPTTNYRGNVTTTSSWTDIAANQFVQTHAQYDNFGNLRKAWDAKGNLSEVEYGATYKYAYPTKTKSAIPDPSGTTGANQAFETTIVYDFNTGLPLSSTDANGQTSTVEYNDALLRPTKTIAPNGHQTITEYGAGTTEATRFVKVKTQIDEQKWQEGYSWYDGIGRATKAQSVDSAGDIFTETEYDQMSRPKKATNPYRTGETKLWTESFYDDLSRVTKVKTPDNAEVLTAYSLATTGANIGTVVTVTDQAGKQRRSVTNGLGQLTRVDEPNDANQLGSVDTPVQPTLYSYDTLNNLINVNQGTAQLPRTFQYDSLSRLKQASNPESGVVSYLYDANGNLTRKTDARQIQTIYSYDALNRVTLRDYADTTADVSYFYDNQPNAKGRLTKVSSSVSQTEYISFDILGRVLSHKQMTDGNAYTTSYNYNLSGALIEETYPSGRVVRNVLDNDGDLSIVQSKKNQSSGFFNYAKNFTYTSAGAVSSMQLGNGKWESTQFNSRLQPTQIALGTVQNGTDKLKLNYDYGTTNNNGNVQSQTITVPTVGTNQGFTAIQNYTYDNLNRLKSAQETISGSQTWKQTFTFDRYGNRNFDVANTTTLGSCPQMQCNPQIDTANNRFATGQGYTFDLAGNLITDATGRSFVYDAENKQKSVSNTSGTIGTYLYDGDGKRVKKVSVTEETIFVYDALGKLVAEYSNQISATPQVSYLTSDHLGSPRINTDANGNVIARHDYLPFGEDLSTPQRTAQLGYAADTVRQKFTGYERDNETDLDFAQARMYASRLGRFTTADPELQSMKPMIPQSWNRYSYVLGNPLVYIDPNGELWIRNTGDNRNETGKAYSWVDSCGEGQTCYEAIASAESNNKALIIYGSNGADDKDFLLANKNGVIDVRALSQHHNAEFIVADGQNVPEEFLSTQAATALFNVAKSYSEAAPGDDKLVFTAGSASTGKPGICGGQPCHKSHQGGRNVDLRYMDSNGKPLQGDNAYKDADITRTNWLIKAFSENGLSNYYTGDNSRFGQPDKSPKYRDANEKVHRHHLHVGISKPEGK